VARTIALDFDGVLHSYMKGWQGADVLEPPTPGARDFVATLRAAGYEVVVTSTRAATPEGRVAMLAWLQDHGFPQMEVTDRKVPCLLTIDDRVLRFDGMWPTLARIEAATTPWNRT
jgi:hypothetical protein